MISVLVVNLNNLDFTKNCINDLISQDIEFDLTLVDQNSNESGTEDFLHQVNTLPIRNVEIIKNNYNKNLNTIWNEFVDKSCNEFICLLNNDVRLCPNFLSSAIEVFDLGPFVGFVNHTTNRDKYKHISDTLNYSIIDIPYRQGWDPIFRKSCYNKIPESLKVFYGDDYIYSKLYSSGMKGAYVLNSPMIHYCSQTGKKQGVVRNAKPDAKVFYNLDLEHKDMDFIEEFSSSKPEFETDEFVKNISYHNFLRNF